MNWFKLQCQARFLAEREFWPKIQDGRSRFRSDIKIAITLLIINTPSRMNVHTYVLIPAEANQILRFCIRCHGSTQMGCMTVAMWSKIWIDPSAAADRRRIFVRRKADALLKSSHVKRARYAHTVTCSTLWTLLRQAFDAYREEDPQPL